MATELNFTARLDTSQFLSQVDQARTHFGLTFGGVGSNDFSGGIASQFQQMFAGMEGGGPGSGFGHTFSNPDLLYNLNYGGGASGATSLSEEWAVHRGGIAAAMPFKPPGVSGADYALAVEKNYINRQLEATHGANMAGQSAFFSGVAGLAGGEIASAVATPIGAAVGGALASRFLGAGAAGAGAFVGGLAAGWMAYNKGSEFIGGEVEQHYAKIEQISGITTELGELAGGGRGLKRTQRYELGVSARNAAKDLGMDFQEMGDILALGRQSNMMPNSTDPGKFREQAREFARAIEEGAQILNTSLSGATQVIRSGAMSGMGAQESIVRAAGVGADNFLAQQSQMMAFSQAGMATGRGMGYTGAQGSGVFMGALGGVSRAGLSYEEMQIAGGRFAAAQFVGTTQMAMAKSPLGNLQMMAAMGGGDMAGMSMLDLPGAALGGLSSGGGDMMTNAARFMVHQNEYRRGIGAGGIRALSQAQLQMGGDMIASMMPDLSANDAQRMYAQSMGMDPDQAKLLVGGINGSGGGLPGMTAIQKMNAVEALQGTLIGAPKPVDPGSFSPRSFGSGYAMEGALTGATMGAGVVSVPGAIIGGAVGWVAGNLGALKDSFSGPGIFATATEKADYWSRQQAQAYEDSISEAKRKFGYTDINKEAGARFLTGDMSGVRLNMDSAKVPLASMRSAASMRAMGVHEVRAGAGSIRMDGTYFSAADVQQVGNMQGWQSEISDSAHLATLDAAVSGSFGSGIDKDRVSELSLQFRMNYETVRLGATPGDPTSHYDVETLRANAQSDQRFGTARIGVRNAGENLLGSAKRMIGLMDSTGAHGAVRKRLLQKLGKVGGLYDPEVRGALETMSGMRLRDLTPAFAAGRGGAVAMGEAEDAELARERNFLQKAFGGGHELTDGERAASTAIRNQMGDATANLYEAHLNKALPSAYYKELQENRHYVDAKDQILAGHMDSAKKELQIAATETLAAGGDKYRGFDAPRIDPNRKFERPDIKEVINEQKRTLATLHHTADTITSMGQSAAGVYTAIGQLEKLNQQEVAKLKDHTTFVEQMSAEKKDLGTKPSQRRKVSTFAQNPIEHAVGFGQQESAMASILKSLRSTERTLGALEKRVVGPGANPQTNTTGGS